MAGKFGMKDGTEYLPKYNWAGGMNDELLDADRGGFETSIAMLTGGEPMNFGDLGSLEVGAPYEMDPMGEERGMMTFEAGSEPEADHFIGMLPTETPARQAGASSMVGDGKKVNVSSPQTYSEVGSLRRQGGGSN